MPSRIAESFDSSNANPTASITVPSGHSDRYMAATVFVRNGTSTPTVTANGDSMTQVTVIGSNPRFFLFELVNPDEGTYDVVASMGGSPPSDTTMRVCVYENVHQTTPKRGAPEENSGTLNSSSLAVPSAVGDLVVDFLAAHNSTANWTAGAGQTELTAFNSDGSTARQEASEETGAAGDVTMSWSKSTAIAMRHVAFSLQPPGGAQTVTVTALVLALVLVSPSVVAEGLQIARPIADVTTTGWEISPVAEPPVFWSTLDETTPSDTDRASSPSAPGDDLPLELRLTALVEPASTTAGGTLRIRMRQE